MSLRSWLYTNDPPGLTRNGTILMLIMVADAIVFGLLIGNIIWGRG